MSAEPIFNVDLDQKCPIGTTIAVQNVNSMVVSEEKQSLLDAISQVWDDNVFAPDFTKEQLRSRITFFEADLTGTKKVEVRIDTTIAR